MDHQVLQDNCLTHVTMAKVQTQSTAIKDPKIEEFKPKIKDFKPTNNSFGNLETFKKAQKNSKKGFKKRNVNKKTLALVFLLLGRTQPLIKQGLKALKKISPGSQVITVIKSGTIPRLVPNARKTTLQKTSSSFDNIYIGD